MSATNNATNGIDEGSIIERDRGYVEELPDDNNAVEEEDSGEIPLLPSEPVPQYDLHNADVSCVTGRNEEDTDDDGTLDSRMDMEGEEGERVGEREEGLHGVDVKQREGESHVRETEESAEERERRLEREGVLERMRERLKHGERESTLPELLSQSLPDASLPVPEILVVGAQSSGKTMLVLQLLLYYLLPQREGVSVSDSMGETLLHILRTGRSLVTRRPTVISLRHCKGENNGNSVDMEVLFRGERGKYDTPAFNEVLHLALPSLSAPHPTSHTTAVYEEVLEVSLSSVSLPNLRIIDTPGLVKAPRRVSRGDREGERDESGTLVDLLRDKMRETVLCGERDSEGEKGIRVIVVVEPATLDELDNSLVLPEML